jgi:sterol-4alpha-carboxylate 3-dehydrogenase (decarboxylating)
VNVTGSRNILLACQATGVKALVYTSSMGVTYDGKAIDGLTEETAKIPSKGYDAYHHTKAVAEKFLLEANDEEGLKTVALRCCGMIGFVF